MSDSLMMIIGIFIAVILMFIFPLMQFAQRTDELAQTTAHVAVSEFVENVTTKGEITQLDYDRLVAKLSSTGNRFDIQIEAQLIDDNSRRKTTIETAGAVFGEYKYYSVYTSTILDAVNGEAGTYKLKKDDYITVTVKNADKTLATQLKNVFYRLSGKRTYEIGTTVSSVVQHSSLSTELPDIALAEVPVPELQPIPEPDEEPDEEPDNPPGPGPTPFQPTPGPEPSTGETVKVTYILKPDKLYYYQSVLSSGYGKNKLDDVIYGCEYFNVRQTLGPETFEDTGITKGSLYTVRRADGSEGGDSIFAVYDHDFTTLVKPGGGCGANFSYGWDWIVVDGNGALSYPDPGKDIKSGSMVHSTNKYIVNEDTVLLIDIEAGWAKPVIYLYPTEETEINVKVADPNRLTTSYPRYKDSGWNVIAKPDGTLKDTQTGRELYCLYYEANNGMDKDAHKDGFIVKGEDMQSFLEEKLAILGLNEREAEEFIVYWLPKLEKNKYNFIRFAESEYINSEMPLDISPAPDNLIRVLMEYKAIEEQFEVEEQRLTTPSREGYTVVEWGATEIN